MMSGIRSVLLNALVALLLVDSACVEADSPTFFRGVNLNGPAIEIDGQAWLAGDSPTLQSRTKAFENHDVPLKPSTDANRARMIRSSRWDRDADVDLTGIPPGAYQVFVYVWEDNAAERFAILLNGRIVVTDYNSGRAGQWKRLGPWRTVVKEGVIRISTRGGSSNLSGIEVWSGDGTVPDPIAAQFAGSPTDDQLKFFESRIRPLLIDNCYSCHSVDADEPGGGLLLDSRAAIVKGGFTEPPIVPGDPDNSLLIKAVTHASPDLKMPPESRLNSDQIADLAEWIRMKAPDPRVEDTVAARKSRSEIDWDKAKEFWSLRPVTVPPIPAVKHTNWPASDIDRFVLAKLEAVNLAPADDADRRTLIRRATFDLIGLPPSPAEVEVFVADRDDHAFEKVVDRLLQSRQYGERWGRYWLDVVRYSDTAGDNSDFPVPQMSLYRNWVIEAFNRDVPFDQFVREQLAGDLLEGGTPEEKRSRLIATGYIANSRRFGSRVDDYPQHLTIEDTLDNLGRTFLATTINCARCHNHKFDPITAEDYYALYGIFHSTKYPWPGIELDQRQRDFVALPSPDEIQRVQRERKERLKSLDAEVKRIRDLRDAAGADERKALNEQVKIAETAARKVAGEPWPYETFYAVTDAATIEDVAVQIKGDPAKSGDLVRRRFLKVLNGQTLPPDDSTSGRLQLANWIVDPANPLTPRVMANRIWLNHFGRGIVPTPNDFGRQGKPATHPELLDWLARRLMDSGWSVKALHRDIMLSRTYRMSSLLSAAARDRDPGNELLSAFSRRRLDAEAIRDTLLLLGGNLDPTPGGEHPFPPQSEWKFTQHNPFKEVYKTNRRSVYLMTQRIQRHPYLAIFDGADPSVSTPYRLTSTTPLQALFLLNDQFLHEQASGFAKRLLTERPDDASRIEFAWQLLFSRGPEAEEREQVQAYLASARSEFNAASIPASNTDVEAWQSTARSLLRLNELVYVD